MRRIVGSFALLSVIAGTGFWWTQSDPTADDPKLFANHVWTERVRRDDRDMVLYFVPVEVGSKRGGSLSRSSKYAFGGEVFGWKRDGNAVNLTLPQSQRTVKLGVRTWTCKDAPKGFDLCLEITQGSDKLQLYSRQGWKVPNGEDLPIGAAGLPIAVEMPDVALDCADCTEGSLEALFGL